MARRALRKLFKAILRSILSHAGRAVVEYKFSSSSSLLVAPNRIRLYEWAATQERRGFFIFRHHCTDRNDYARRERSILI